MATTFPLADLIARLQTALTNLYRFDNELVELNASERSLCHKLAEHLQRQFQYWHVDCEYNKLGNATKQMDEHDVFPDIIVHRRDTTVDLLVIEVKKANGKSKSGDLEKLRKFMTYAEYRYVYGLFLCLGKKGCKEAILFHRSSKEIDLTSALQTALKELGYGV